MIDIENAVRKRRDRRGLGGLALGEDERGRRKRDLAVVVVGRREGHRGAARRSRRRERDIQIYRGVALVDHGTVGPVDRHVDGSVNHRPGDLHQTVGGTGRTDRDVIRRQRAQRGRRTHAHEDSRIGERSIIGDGESRSETV